MNKVLIIVREEGNAGLTWANKLHLIDSSKATAWEVNEVARAIRDFGCEPLAYTSTCDGSNYHGEYLSQDIQVVGADKIYEMISEISAVVMVGTVAKAGTQSAYMDGTFNHVGWRDYAINERFCGEIGLYKTYFSHFNIPIVFVSGDVAACNEAEEEISGVKTLAVKSASCRNKATVIEGEKERFYEACLDALKSNIEASQPIETPISVKIYFTRTEYCADAMRWYRSSAVRLDARTVEKKIEKITSLKDFT